jgi:hypothetical protein
MTRTRIPDEVLTAAHDRSRARAAQDWAEADRLRADIEAAGWRIVDRGTDFALSPAAPPDVADGERVRYGASTNVPARSGERPVGLATLVLHATDDPDAILATLDGVRAHAPGGTTVVVVADDPSAEVAGALDTLADDATEVVWTSERLGLAAAVNIGIRRAAGPVVVVLGAGVAPTGDVVTPLARALDDPSVAVAGGWGLTGTSLRSFVDVASGDVDVVTFAALAFRRDDGLERGPLEERFRGTRPLEAWWSLVLRDEGEGIAPRRAVAVDGVPARIAASSGLAEPVSPGDPADARGAKRDFYRLSDRFGARRDLLSGADGSGIDDVVGRP